jgi:hypothetical protein
MLKTPSSGVTLGPCVVALGQRGTETEAQNGAYPGPQTGRKSAA